MNGERHALLEGIGRVAALDYGDVTGDGLTDIVAAVFGWQETGGLCLASWNCRPDGVLTHSLVEAGRLCGRSIG